MSHLTPISLPITTNPCSLVLANLSDARSCCSLGQVTKPPAYVLGEQLGQLRLVKIAWSVTSYFYSKLPSLSLPGAHASATTAHDIPAVCTVPTGSYEKSCYGSEVTYSPGEKLCKLTARCAAIYEDFPPRLTSFLFAPGDAALVLENNNGTLVARCSREEVVNARLDELSQTALTPEALVREQEAIIETLNAGDVITVSSDLHPALMPPEKWAITNEAFSAFQRIALSTGGIMGHSPFSESLTPLIKQILAHILKAAGSSKSFDIVFVIDTTSSMQPYIAQLQNSIVQILEQLEGDEKENGSTCRVALVEYRDKDTRFLQNQFLTRVDTDLTSDLHQVQQTVRELKAFGGGDISEAVLDALFVAKNELSWDPNAKHVVILIGDAPPHPQTQDGLHDEAAIIAQYQASSTHIAIYPIFSG